MPEMVYFAETTWPDVGAVVKIGYSRSLKARIANLDSLRRLKIVLIGAAPGGPDEEAVLHSIFQSARFQGEWFLATSRLLRLARFCEITNTLPPLILTAAAARRDVRAAEVELSGRMRDASRSLNGLSARLASEDGIIQVVERGTLKALACGRRP
jgi:hypothetical protein